jgi:hypothetical protein
MVFFFFDLITARYYFYYVGLWRKKNTPDPIMQRRNRANQWLMRAIRIDRVVMDIFDMTGDLRSVAIMKETQPGMNARIWQKD